MSDYLRRSFLENLVAFVLTFMSGVMSRGLVTWHVIRVKKVIMLSMIKSVRACVHACVCVWMGVHTCVRVYAYTHI